MPTEASLSDLTTDQIFDRIKGEVETQYTEGQLWDEIEGRKIPMTDKYPEELRGGIRPSHIPTH